MSKPRTSTEVQGHFQGKIKRNYVRSCLAKNYRKGKLVRNPFKTQYGYIYAKPKDKRKIIKKLKEVIPPYVRNAVELIVTRRKILTLNELVELTQGRYESLEYYLDNVFKKQLYWIKSGYFKSFKIYWSAKYTRKELINEFASKLSKRYGKRRVDGIKFERTVKKLLDDYLLNLPFKVEKMSKGTPSGRYYFDEAYKLYIFSDISPIHLKVEIKSHIPSLVEVTYFYRKIREYTHGTIIPMIIAPAFPSVVYRSFGDIIYLILFDKLKEFVQKVVSVSILNKGVYRKSK